MNSLSTPNASKSPIFDYTVAFLIFMGFLSVVPLFEKAASPAASVWLARPVYLIYPIQTVVCGLLLLYVGKRIEFRGIAYLSICFATGFFVFAIWTSPQFFHWAGPRYDGFNLDVFQPGSAEYWVTVILRFLRLVVVVPFLEEIFWRGFLMRFLIREPFQNVPFGQFQAKAFSITAVAFAAAHYGNSWTPGPDFVPALITGVIFNAVACLTKSLGSCVFVHAVTNLFLGLYIVFTKQWGFW